MKTCKECKDAWGFENDGLTPCKKCGELFCSECMSEVGSFNADDEYFCEKCGG